MKTSYILQETYNDIWRIDIFKGSRLIGTYQVNPIQAEAIIKTIEAECDEN